MKRKKLIKEMTYAKEIHKYYLKLPKDKATGSHKWHRRWINTYKEVIKVLRRCKK